MAVSYPSMYYTSKYTVANSTRDVADPDTPLEHKIHARVAEANRLYFAGKYGAALGSYLEAWNLLPRSIWPWFPEFVATVSASELLAADLSKGLLELSSELLRFGGPDVALLGAGAIDVDPPEAVKNVAKRFGANVPGKAESHYQRGVAFLERGQADAAMRDLERARTLVDDDQDLVLAIESTLGIAEVRMGRHEEGARRFQELLSQHRGSLDADVASALEHNVGVALTLAGKDTEAGAHFIASSRSAPLGLDWSVSYSANPGIASISRPVGLGGLPMMVRAMDRSWHAVDSSPAAKAQSQFIAYREDGAIVVELNANPVGAIESQLLQSRVGATSLAELSVQLQFIPQFVAYLTQVQGFVLPLAIADCYTALGRYDDAISYYQKARDYKYLNHAIERPMLWTRNARAWFRKGMALYRDRDMAGAQAAFEQIVRVVDGGFELTGPLYSGGFASLVTLHKQYLESPDKRGFSALDYQRRILLLDALSNLKKILAGINYLGFPEDIVPIHSWRYLQNVARYFANQAIQAERAYVSFRDTAEREEATRLVLEQAVDAQQVAVEVEKHRVEASEAQQEVAELSADLADVRLENAIERRDDFAATSAELAVLEEINGWATGPMDKAVIDGAWADVLGVEPGTYDTYQIVRRVAALRAQISHAYELRDKERQIEELQASKAVADAQVEVAEEMLDVAKAQLELAELRADQAQEQLADFEDQEFTPELWHALADAQGEISERYLGQAIGAAFLMERAFEFEYDLEVDRIRFDYGRSELQGLLAADFLLTDVDQFAYDRILHTEKQMPLKTRIALADRYPHQFFQEFQRTGRLEFETLLDDFDLDHPGAHVRKLRRVEAVVEGLIGREGVHGTLSNSGISRYRDRTGAVRTRLQKPETMPLSLFDMRRDGFVFTAEESVLEVFENSGVAGGWTLELPPASNDLDFGAISNVHLVLYYDAYHSQSVQDRVRAELAATALHEHQLGFRLKSHFPDEFFALQDTGEVTFAIDAEYLPYNHTDARVLSARIVVRTEAGVSSQHLVLRVTTASGGLEETQTTDANGMIASTSPGAALAAAHGAALADTWTIHIDEAANAAAFAAGFTWESVGDVFFFVEYRYVARGETSRNDDFSSDTLTEFDVVDDAAATNSAPSGWSHEAAGEMRQSTNIHGGPSGDATSVERPGTYLVRKESAEWPSLSDVCVRTRFRSGDDDGIGLVFRYQDADNFYFVLLDRERGVRRLGKKVGGTFQELDEPAVAEVPESYALNQTHELTVAAVADAIAVALDGELVLFGRDGSLSAPGRAGLYAWGNVDARFEELAVRSL